MRRRSYFPVHYALRLSLKFFLLLLSIISTLFMCEYIYRFYVNSVTAGSHIPEYTESVAKESTFASFINPENIQPESFNIYYFGESTMKGTPYGDTIPILVEKILNQRVGSKKLSWVNLAESGIDLNETKTRLQWVINNKETLTYPSLFVIYSGHNEFLKYGKAWGLGFSGDRYYTKYINWLVDNSYLAKMLGEKLKLYKLDLDERSFFDKPAFTQEELNQTITKYAQGFQQIISLAHNNNIPVIISTAVGNYSDFEPNRSVFCNTDNNQMLAFKKIMDFAAEASKLKHFQEALANYKKALSICDTFAETYYQIGKTYSALRDYSNAQNAFESAVDNDRMPIRAISAENDVIRHIMQTSNTKIIDAISNFKNHAENGLIGYNLMIDGHHPNLEGYLLLSTQVAGAISEIYPEAKITQLSESVVRDIFSKDDIQVSMQYQLEAEWLFRMSTWRYDPEMRLGKAEEYLDQVLAINPKNVYALLDQMVIYYLRKDNKKALESYHKALETDPISTRQFLRNPWIYQVILRARAN